MDDDLTMDLNILVKNLPIKTNNMLNAIAGWKNVRKHELIKEALEEFVHNHKRDLPRYKSRELENG